MTVRKILLLLNLIFLAGCFFLGGGQEKKTNESKPPQSKFVESGGWADYNKFKEAFDLRFKRNNETWEKNEDFFYVVVNNPDPYEDYHILSFHKDSLDADIYKIFSIEGFGGMWAYSFDSCMGTFIKEKSEIVDELCMKKKSISKSLFEKIKSFLLDEKESVLTFYCFGDLNMTYYDGEKNYYFDMSKPSCLDENIKKDPRIPEYIDFYNEMAAFIKQDFSACRWDNFGNRDKMIRECGKFNWRWKEKYPDLIE